MIFLGSIDLPYTCNYANRHGQMFWYYRRRGRKVRLPGDPGGVEWLKVYWRERAIDEARKPVKPEAPRTFKQLAIAYYASPAFRQLKSSTKKTYRCSIGQFIERFGTFHVSEFRFRHVNKIFGDMHDRPAAANKMLKRLRSMFSLAVQLEWIDRDPSLGIRFYKVGEIHTWTHEEIEQFLDRWPAGSVQRLAFLLQLYTGQRNGDVVNLQWPKDGLIYVTQEKTDVRLRIPVDPKLQDELRLHPRDHLIIISTSFGHARSVAGYGNWMRDAIRAAHLPERCSPHGLRKAAAKHLADAGCTTKQIQAITGHRTLGEIERYTREADQEKLAREAVAKRFENQNCPPESGNVSTQLR
jgi:integrase